ncbi:threonine transporter RhtB [Streptomyces inusitatus]|uniref:Threonine transporter RhtB n=1 Tax=Streptomyces inusitatus TaxID=68221 RepID=A0A918Q0S1_9ACTN|nr:LysE family translocator [Streptomyces inusitatus]GGZ30045.1 threonine transporter RhtB [Streptomyces inusitatus]
MVTLYAAAGFLAAVLPLTVTPGASLALLIQHVTDGGRRRALPVVLGTATGLYIHATLAAVGLSALVTNSARAFTAVKLIGAAYLICLGLWTWRSATRRAAPAPSRRSTPKGSDSVYVQALFANVLNPKAASVYLTLAPQFVVRQHSLGLGGQILTLATAHVLLIALWLLLWTLLVRRASRLVREPGFKRAIARVTAVVLLALGVRTALV